MNSLSLTFPPSAFLLLTTTHTQTVPHGHTSLCSNTHTNSRAQCCTLKWEQRGHFSLYGWEMERTLWFCCSVALFSSPHLFKAVRQQSAAINLNRSALPALLWLDVMISGCHSTHWYVSLCDPSASLFCHEQPGVYHGHTGGSTHAPFTPHYLTTLCYHHPSSPSLLCLAYRFRDIWTSLVKKAAFLLKGMFVKKMYPELLIKAVACWPFQKKNMLWSVLCGNNKLIFPCGNIWMNHIWQFSVSLMNKISLLSF